MKTNNNLSKLFSLSIALLLVACASTPNTPNKLLWDTEGIQRVAVMPFEVIGQSDLEREAGKRLYSMVKARFLETGRFIIVDTVAQADAVFRGELIDIMREPRIALTPPTDGYDIAYVISYCLTRTSDGSIVGENAVYRTTWVMASTVGSIDEDATFACLYQVNDRLRQDLGLPPDHYQVQLQIRNGMY